MPTTTLQNGPIPVETNTMIGIWITPAIAMRMQFIRFLKKNRLLFVWNTPCSTLEINLPTGFLERYEKYSVETIKLAKQLKNNETEALPNKRLGYALY